MDDNPLNRKRTRLKGYDYNASGLYFLTLCAKNREHLFSRIIVGRGIPDAPIIELSDYGRCVENSLIYINDNRKNLHIDHYVIMPNHVHLLVAIRDDGNGVRDDALGNRALQNHATQNRALQDHNVKNEYALAIIPKFISSLKRYTNKKSQYDLWQNGYFDHIIRDEQDYLMHCKYIDENPAKWTEDKYFI